MDGQELIQRLQDMAMDLGCTPKRDDFYAAVKGAEGAVRRCYGNFTLLIQASGLEPEKNSRVITNKVFERKLEPYLASYEPRPTKPYEAPPTLACISDIHWPFCNQRVIDRFYRYVDDEKPEHVFLNGDAWDMYSFAKFPRSHNLFTPREEQTVSRDKNIEFWREIKKLSPKSKCKQTMGNHDVRPLKRVLEQFPAAEDWVGKMMNELFTFDGVETIFDPRDIVMLPGNVGINHGFKSKIGEHRDDYLMNMIIGHIHRAGILYRRIHGQTLWEMNCGLAGDPEAKGLSYTPTKISAWTPAFGAIDEFGPRVILV